MKAIEVSVLAGLLVVVGLTGYDVGVDHGKAISPNQWNSHAAFYFGEANEAAYLMQGDLACAGLEKAHTYDSKVVDFDPTGTLKNEMQPLEEFCKHANDEPAPDSSSN